MDNTGVTIFFTRAGVALNALENQSRGGGDKYLLVDIPDQSINWFLEDAAGNFISGTSIFRNLFILIVPAQVHCNNALGLKSVRLII